MRSKSMKMVFVARMIRHKSCIFYAYFYFFCSKSIFDQKLFSYCCNKFDYTGSIIYLSCCSRSLSFIFIFLFFKGICFGAGYFDLHPVLIGLSHALCRLTQFRLFFLRSVDNNVALKDNAVGHGFLRTLLIVC